MESYIDDNVTDARGNLVIRNNRKLASVVEDVVIPMAASANKLHAVWIFAPKSFANLVRTSF